MRMSDTKRPEELKVTGRAAARTARVHQKSIPDQVADAIGKGILMRRFVVGQRLVEADLTRELGVSRSTVREALRILASSGVVDLTPHRGAVIRSLTAKTRLVCSGCSKFCRGWLPGWLLPTSIWVTTPSASRRRHRS